MKFLVSKKKRNYKNLILIEKFYYGLLKESSSMLIDH